jgi:hypothetical protein
VSVVLSSSLALVPCAILHYCPLSFGSLSDCLPLADPVELSPARIQIGFDHNFGRKPPAFWAKKPRRLKISGNFEDLAVLALWISNMIVKYS